jgi:uridine kinase
MTWSRGSSLFHHARSKSSIAAYRSVSITAQIGRSEGRITSTEASSFKKSFDQGRHDPSAITSTGVSRRPFLIGVAGGSSSGKTTISERLAEIMGNEHLARIELDSYYADLGDLALEQRRLINYDHPDAFDWPLLNDHLAALANGASVQIPVYDYVEHNRSDETRLVEPARVIVVDGILVFWDQALRDRFDLKIFVDTGADIRLIRRLRRDVAERGRTVENVIDQYLTTVKPAHERFIEPSKIHADVIIPAGGLNRPALEVLLARVREIALDDE